MALLSTLLTILFAGSALLLIVVVLIQEGRGGGLGGAFGGAGTQTFGVGARGITKFTAVVGIVFIVSAVGITLVEKGRTGSLAATTTENP